MRQNDRLASINYETSSQLPSNGDSLNHIVDDIVSRSLFYNAIPYRMNIEK